MIVLSLFDGISCGRVALERAGLPVTTYYASEIDKYALQVSEKNYPDIVRLGDVCDWDKWELPQIDLLLGGSPCQDLSIAQNNRKGLQGERSGLFYRYVDCLEKFRPRYFLYENVASMSKEDKDTITAALGVLPIMINSALVSAQQRKRLYWHSVPNVIQPADKGILLKDILESGIQRDKAYTVTATYGNAVPQDMLKSKRTQVFEPIRLGHINKTPAQAHRIYSVNGKTISLSANGGGLGAKTGLYKIDLPDGDYFIRKLTPIECERLQTLPDDYTEGVSNTQRYKATGNGWTVDVVAHILGAIKQI